MVIWLSFILGLMPALIWLIFFLQEDRDRPEPKGLIFETFILGAVLVFPALYLQVLVTNYILNPLGSPEFGSLGVVLYSLIEELCKLAPVYFIIRKKAAFNEPIDAMMYLVIAALGFASVENVASAISSTNGFELLTLRFIGATLLHVLSSALLGFYWGLAMKRREALWHDVPIGLLIATAVHTAFYYLVVIYGADFQVTIFLATVAFFVFSDFDKLKKGEIKS